jgi:mannosyltransferase
MKHHATLFVVGGSILILLLLSLTLFFPLSLRLDEAQSLWQTGRSFWALIRLVAEDVHTPLYHVVLFGWQHIFGNGVGASRSLSLLFAAFSIPVVYLLGKISANKMTGLFAAAVAALSPFTIWYSSEIRMYSLLLLLAAINQYAFLLFYKHKGTLAWTAYTLSLIAGGLTHYLFGYVLLGQIAFLILHKKSVSRGPALFLSFAWILWALAIGGWAWFSTSLESSAQTHPHLPTPSVIDVFNTIAQFLVGFQPPSINSLFLALWPVIMILGFFSLQRKKEWPIGMNYIVYACVLPLIAAFVISVMVEPIYASRYVIMSLPALAVGVGWLLSSYPVPIRNWLVFVVLIGMGTASLHQAISKDTPTKESFLQAASILSTQTTSAEAVVISPPFTVYPLEFYYRGPAKLTTLPNWNRLVAGSIPAFNETAAEQELQALSQTHTAIWVVLSYDQGYENQLRALLNRDFDKSSEMTLSPGLTVAKYTLKQSSAFHASNTQ